jgi:hypothetical protein
MLKKYSYARALILGLVRIYYHTIHMVFLKSMSDTLSFYTNRGLGPFFF